MVHAVTGCSGARPFRCPLTMEEKNGRVERDNAIEERTELPRYSLHPKYGTQTCPLAQSLSFLQISWVSRFRRLSGICSVTTSDSSCAAPNKFSENSTRDNRVLIKQTPGPISTSRAPSATFPGYFLSRARSLERGGGSLIPPSDLLQKDRSESFFYSLTLHCDLLSGSREPLARPTGERPRTIRT